MLFCLNMKSRTIFLLLLLLFIFDWGWSSVTVALWHLSHPVNGENEKYAQFPHCSQVEPTTEGRLEESVVSPAPRQRCVPCTGAAVLDIKAKCHPSCLLVAIHWVHRLMFPLSSVTYDPVQWWALEDHRPLGKLQLCGRQSARNRALNFCRSCGLRLYHLNYWGKKTRHPNYMSPTVFSSAGQGAWWITVAVGQSHAARCCLSALPGIFHAFVTVELLLTSPLVTRLLQVPFMVRVSAAPASFCLGLGNAADSAQ